MLSKETIEVLEDKLQKLQNAKLVKGFYPKGITIRTKVSTKDAVEYLETIGVDKFNLKRIYVLHDENVNLIGTYENLDDVPQDTYVENSYGEEVYVGENQYNIQYAFNR